MGNHPGRELTPEIVSKFGGLVASGSDLSCAAGYLNVSSGVVSQWLARGRMDRYSSSESGKTHSLYAEFHRAYEHASAMYEMRHQLGVARAAQGGEVLSKKTTRKRGADGEETTTTTETYSQPDWRAAAWLLEHHRPHRWGKVETVRHVEGADDTLGDGPIMVEETFLPDPKRRLALRVAAARMLEREKERIERLQIEGKLSPTGMPTTTTGAVGGANGGTESHGCTVDPSSNPAQDGQTESQDSQIGGAEGKGGAPTASEGTLSDGGTATTGDVASALGSSGEPQGACNAVDDEGWTAD